MPRCVRNYWIEVEVDGRATTIAAGPKGAGGGMRITLYQRSKGEVVKALDIDCKPPVNGGLLTFAVTPDKIDALTVRTER